MSQYDDEKQAMQLLTQKYVDKLTGIWEQIFHPDTCRENLRKLVDHATYFYGELVDESLSRKTFIENEINDLKKEAENLKRLLKTDVQLPCYESNEVPLLIVQSELDKSLEDLREQLRLRKEQICELLLEQDALCEELGEPPRALLADPLPTAEEIENFRTHLESLRDERVERMNKVSTMRREIKNFLQILDLKVNTEHEDGLLNHRQIKMNKETFEGLKRMHDLYGSQVKELRDTIQGMRNKLDTLWDRLKTSPNTRHKFNRYNDFNQHTYELFYDELQRCETLKSQNIKLFVQQIRDEISKWWEKTLKSEVQKSRFSNFTSTCYTDDLLVLHEMELEDLKLYYETNKQIFDLYADRNILWDRMNALESKASEPGRYNNRGGQLLKEEKERKTIATKLPKIEQQICELVRQYEEIEHAPFLVFGENIIDVMAAQWDQKRRDKEMLQSARKNAGKQKSATKTNSTMRTPLSMKNASSVSSLRKTPSTSSLASNAAASSQKRKLNPTDRNTPMAKRSLMNALNSPSVFLKPSTSKNNIQHTTSSAYSSSKSNKLNKSGSSFKSPMKKSKLIATTIRRRSGRHSGNLKKRRSMSKTPSSAKPLPKIVINSCQSDGYSTDYNADDTYESFQKSIEPASRSSLIQNVTLSSDSSRTKRMQRIVDDENTRLAKLPRPRIVNRTPSKQHASFSNLQRTPTHNNHHSPASCATTGRKLTTKNLPIII
ncbi:protein regulator of cytokinesis 1-like [Calliphora vicina]|uniref:protein regulator of cytokinesis 1-like n=1 Tax=Calliphora vicina TaxID=7373 RepID=UPI00325B7A63